METLKTMETRDEKPMGDMINNMDLADRWAWWTWQAWAHVINTWAACWQPHFGLWGWAGAPLATKAPRSGHHGTWETCWAMSGPRRVAGICCQASWILHCLFRSFFWVNRMLNDRELSTLGHIAGGSHIRLNITLFLGLQA